MKVSTTSMSRIASVGTVVGSPSRITRSAGFPTAMVPLSSCSRICHVASIVSGLSACYVSTRSSGPMTSSERDVLATALPTIRMGSIGVTEKSL